MLKKYLIPFQIILLIPFILTGCADNVNREKSDKIEFLCTEFPQYDWVLNITQGADNVEVTLLFDNGDDIHNFQPSADDIIKISNADVLIYNGNGPNDVFDKIVEKNSKQGQVSIDLMEKLGDSPMHDGHHHEGADEHIWLSLKNATELSQIISDEISSLDKENAELYDKNTAEYIAKLQTLDLKFEEKAVTSVNKSLIFADRFPFKYLMEDYSITTYSAFTGCSAETDASFNTLLLLANKVDELSAKYVVTLEKSNLKIAENIRELSKNKGFEVISMNSMQSVYKEDIDAGLSYLSIMEDNLKVFELALN